MGPGLVTPPIGRVCQIRAGDDCPGVAVTPPVYIAIHPLRDCP